MLIVGRSNTLKLRRSAVLREHCALTGLGRCGPATAMDIALLTELCRVSDFGQRNFARMPVTAVAAYSVDDW